MLHVFLSLAMLFGSSTTSNQPSSISVHSILEESSPERVKFTCIIVFGRLREDGSCRGFGICDFLLDVRGGLSAENDFFRAEVEPLNGKLQLSVNRHDLPRKIFDTYFASGNFVVEEAYTISREVCRKLNVREGYTIPAGRYPLVTNGNTINLTL